MRRNGLTNFNVGYFDRKHEVQTLKVSPLHVGSPTQYESVRFFYELSALNFRHIGLFSRPEISCFVLVRLGNVGTAMVTQTELFFPDRLWATILEDGDLVFGSAGVTAELVSGSATVRYEHVQL